MTSTLLSNCRYLLTMGDEEHEYAGAFIGIENGWIRSLGNAAPDGRFDEMVDCSSMVVLPGFINAHHHLYQTLTRGFPLSQGVGLFDWLRMLYPIWAGLDDEMVYASTRTGLAELVLSGCTTCADHLYVFPQGSDAFIDAQVEAAHTVGVRFHATRGSMDFGESRGGLPPDSVVQTLDVILDDSRRSIDRYHDPSPGAKIQIGLAPCSPFSASEELMRDTAALARDRSVQLHTHIAETRDEYQFSLQRFGVSPVELLGSTGWLDSNVWVAHCVHPSDADIARLAGAWVGVAHCPTSNMLLGSGLAPTKQLLEAGVSVGLGVDGSASNDANDLRQEVKQAVLSARARDGSQALTVRQAVRMATRGGAACLGRSDIGSIEVGKAADIVLYDAASLACAGAEEDLVAGVILGGVRPHTVFVHGRRVVDDGSFVALDARDLAKAHNEASRRLIARWRGEPNPRR